MPRFEMVSINEAMLKSSPSKRAQMIQDYLGYIEQVKEGQAGKLQASVGESLRAVRRRLGTAAKLASKDLVIKRVGEDLYFWPKPRRRGRPRKVSG